MQPTKIERISRMMRQLESGEIDVQAVRKLVAGAIRPIILSDELAGQAAEFVRQQLAAQHSDIEPKGD